MNLLLAFIAFNVIVIVHELGHFIAAKKFGIKVLEFSLFIGPKLFSIQRGETLYSLRLIPIMAYVKMEGEEEASDSDRAFNNKPRYARAITAFAGPLANIILAIVLMATVYMIQGFDTTVVQSVNENSPAAVAGIRPGDKIVGYDNQKVYTPNEALQFLYISKGKKSEIEYKRNGEIHKTLISPQIIPEHNTYMLGITLNPDSGNSNVIASVAPDNPAQKAGLIPGDRIIKLNNISISSGSALRDYLTKNGEKEAKITVLRNGSEVNVSITPKAKKVTEQYDLGFEFKSVKGDLWSSLKQSCIFAYSITRSVGYSLVWLIQGKATFKDMMGPIGMVDTISSVVQQGANVLSKFIILFQWTALLSIAVGATNLIPFPMLDGNRLLLIGIEAIRRKPIKPEREAFISMVGFVLIILLAIYAAYNDISRIIRG